MMWLWPQFQETDRLYLFGRISQAALKKNTCIFHVSMGFMKSVRLKETQDIFLMIKKKKRSVLLALSMACWSILELAVTESQLGALWRCGLC